MLSYSSNLPLLSCSISSSSVTRFLNPIQYSKLRLPTVSHHSGQTQNTIVCNTKTLKTHKWVTNFLTVGVAAMALVVGVGPTLAAESAPPSLPLLSSSIELHEPSNALSLPTWAIHVSSVAEWVIAMALVWEYGEKPGNESWKGLSWGMVPLLGGAMCACTWHFFYNAESLEVLVALQAALTVVGNATLCVAAFRIYKSQSSSENV